jgi:colanic acid/amylovoran biosynthesis protein
MLKILLTCCHDHYNLGIHYNKGGEAVLISTIQMLKKYFPDSEIVSLIQVRDEFAKQYGITVIQNKKFHSKNYSLRTSVVSSTNLCRAWLWSFMHKRYSFIANVLVTNRELKERINADVIIDISMDHFSDDFGIIAEIEQSKDMLLGYFLNKPVVMWAQSVGPFKSRLTCWLAIYTLNKISIIMLREDVSIEYLRQLGISKAAIFKTADPAFTLFPSNMETTKDIFTKEGISIIKKPIVGITLSWSTLIRDAKHSKLLNLALMLFRVIRFILPEFIFDYVQKLGQNYTPVNITEYVKTKKMNLFVDQLIENLDCSIILIPHCTDPILDDRTVASSVISLIKRTDRVFTLKGDYSAPEYKAIIGLCDLFIGSKMHSNIAALSLKIPTVSIQYGHKFYGIMKSLGQEKYICDDFISDEIMEKVRNIWSRREMEIGELGVLLLTVNKLASYNAEIVSEFMKIERLEKSR